MEVLDSQFSWKVLDDSWSKDEGWGLVDLVLSGGAPWGFTLKGGLEYREPLLVTKVEQGSRAASVSLQVGDEIVQINAVPLSGYRHEAVYLVKRSYKRLALVVRRKMKMVDIVTQTMPTESDVHVARNFLSKILRSSMRRNESSSKPQTWHPSKVSENQPEAHKIQSTSGPEPIWKTKSPLPASDAVSNGLEQNNMQQVSGQVSSVATLDSLEPRSHVNPFGCLSTYKKNSLPEHPVSVGGVSSSDLAFNPLSSGILEHSLPRTGVTSNENMFSRASVAEQGGHSERPRYLQLPMGNGGRVSPRMDEQVGSRFSSSGRSNHGHMWHIPGKETSPTPCPSPPQPPLRCESFVATRVHERNLVLPHSERPGLCSQSKSQGRNVDRQHGGHHASQKGPEAQGIYSPLPKKDFLHPLTGLDDYNSNHLSPNKLYSLSSSDIRQGQNPFACLPQHQRQHSDDSPFYLSPEMASAPKTQSVGSYYRSLQNLPTNTCSQSQARSSTASLSSTTLDHNPDCTAHFRYYCITAQQPAETAPPSQSQATETWSTNTEPGPVDRSSASLLKTVKAKYPPPHLQYPESKSSNIYSQSTTSPPSPSVPHGLVALTAKPRSQEREGDGRRRDGGAAEMQVTRYLLTHNTEHRNSAAIPHRDSQQNPWVCLEERKICPLKTPMLHSLAQESRRFAEKQLSVPMVSGPQEAADISSGKYGRRSDRYATTLRNEIQQKRAQLQKSRSAAALTCPGGAKEDPEPWKSAGTSTSSSDSYKDHLKEAQARVLQATSFKRRDLELPGSDRGPGQPSLKTGPTGCHVSRIRGRKRFTMYKRVQSFSEPDKINEVGVEQKVHQEGGGGSFDDQKEYFKGASKPALMQFQHNPYEDNSGSKTRALNMGNSDVSRESVAPTTQHMLTSQGYLTPEIRQDPEEQQRLGTFAEFQATWNMQRKATCPRMSGRYRSAENILESRPDECLVLEGIHERSRSSPSADFYGQEMALPAQNSTEHFVPQGSPDQQEAHSTSQSERGAWGKPMGEPDPFSKSPDSTAENMLGHRHMTALLPFPNKHKPDRTDPALLLPSYPHPQAQNSLSQYPLPPKHRSSAPPTPVQAEMDRPTPPETSTSPCSPQESHPASQAVSTAWSCITAPEPQPDPEPPTPTAGNDERSGHGHPFATQNLPQPVSASSTPSSSLHCSSELMALAAETARSPSPQFFPLRLTDEPPVAMQCRDQDRRNTEEVWRDLSAVRKVPIRIVHTETPIHPLPHAEGARAPEGPTTSQLRGPGSEQLPSVFRAYTHQGPGSPHDSHTVTAASENATATEPSRSSRVSAASCYHEEDGKALARLVIGKDKRLVEVLDQSTIRNPMDVMGECYPQGEQALGCPQPCGTTAPKQFVPRDSQERREEDSMAASVALVTSSSYFSTSAPKAELLIKMKDMQEHLEQEENSEDELDCDLSSKKQELIDSLGRKLQVLREARESLQEDMQENNTLGEEVEEAVQAVCKPNELDKFRMFVGDLDKVVSLLLSLSGRLARVENALSSLEEGTPEEERHTLMEKRSLLIRQHEDAKELKENLDRRERLVYAILASYLNAERLADYRHFVKMKSALIIEQRKLEDKIKLGEEQLKCLRDSLPLEQRLLL